MLIIHTSAYAKKYRKLYIGLATFVLSGNIMLITCYNVVVVYKNNVLIGSVTKYDDVYVDGGDDNLNVYWSDTSICGFSLSLSKHGIPFYNYDDRHISVYGFMVTQYISDKIVWDTEFDGMYESISQL